MNLVLQCPSMKLWGFRRTTLHLSCICLANSRFCWPQNHLNMTQEASLGKSFSEVSTFDRNGQDCVCRKWRCLVLPTLFPAKSSMCQHQPKPIEWDSSHQKPQTAWFKGEQGKPCTSLQPAYVFDLAVLAAHKAPSPARMGSISFE